MAHSSTPGTPKIMSTNGTMVGVPTPGGSEIYRPADAGETQVHGKPITGGNNAVKAQPASGSKFDWSEAGGNQAVKPA